MRLSVNCSGWSLVLAAFLLLCIPLPWIIAATVSALIHEFFHYAMIRFFGNHVFEISVTSHGILMKTTPLSCRQELVCALAGPVGSILLFFSSRCIPRIGICAGMQGLFNLLPVYPLDGGRALRAFAYLLLPESAAQSFCQWILYGSCVLILMTGILCSCFFRLGFAPVCLSLLLLSRAFSEKFLANRVN